VVAQAKRLYGLLLANVKMLEIVLVITLLVINILWPPFSRFAQVLRAGNANGSLRTGPGGAAKVARQARNKPSIKFPKSQSLFKKP